MYYFFFVVTAGVLLVSLFYAFEIRDISGPATISAVGAAVTLLVLARGRRRLRIDGSLALALFPALLLAAFLAGYAGLHLGALLQLLYFLTGFCGGWWLFGALFAMLALAWRGLRNRWRRPLSKHEARRPRWPGAQVRT